MTKEYGKKREQLIATYTALPIFEQKLLELLSVIYEPVNRSTVLNCLRRAGIKGPDDTWLILPTLTPFITDLQKLDLIDKQCRCHNDIIEWISPQAVIANTFSSIAQAVQHELPLTQYVGNRSQRCWRLMRDLRIAVYTNDLQQVENILPFFSSQCQSVFDTKAPLVNICAKPFYKNWFKVLPASGQFYFLDKIFSYSIANLTHYEQPVSYLNHVIEHDTIPVDERLPFHRLLAGYLLWRGQLEDIDKLIDQHPESFSASGLEGCVLFLKGKTKQAVKLFENDLLHIQEITGSKKIYFCSLAGIFFILALLKHNDKPNYSRLVEFISIVRSQVCDDTLLTAFALLETVIMAQKNEIVEVDTVIASAAAQNNSITTLFSGLAHFWLNNTIPADLTSQLFLSVKKADKNGFAWLALEYAELLCRMEKEKTCCVLASQIRNKSGMVSVIDAPKLQEPWQRSLQALIAVTGINDKRSIENSQKKRLVWMIDYNGTDMSITPKEQKYSPQRQWSKGRPVALSRLLNGINENYISDQDKKICQAIVKTQANLTTDYYIDQDAALPALIGHPLIFLEQFPETQVELLKGEPELLVEESDDFLSMTFINEIADKGITIVRESQTRFRIIEVTEKYQQIAKILGQDGLAVPLSAKVKALTAISNISSIMTVHAAIDEKLSHLTEIKPDPGIIIQLLPFSLGFKLEMHVKPFRTGGPYLRPGKGTKTVIAEVEGRRLQTHRDLQAEKINAQEVLSTCPTLTGEIGGGYTWTLPAVEDCLQVLVELQSIQEKVVIEWPEGEKLSIRNKVSFSNLHLKIRKARSWFEISGDLHVDKSLVLQMKELMQMVKNNPKRFIPLGAGQFFALTKEFHRRLQDLNLFSGKAPTTHEDKGIRIHPLAALALEEFTENLKHVSVDQGWKAQIQLIKEAQDLKPSIPSTLKGHLRDYQVEGYRWLARLAHWGLGACLADDMGLGKTLQALAIILSRASNGATLVVAPTSVCMNWQDETNRFAPTLNVFTLGNKDRKKLIEQIGQNDILITSYTLLQQEAKLFSAKKWETIVLDESQAIKNIATKRSRAAMSLNGGFKLLTTGTPIENNLGELWNLFNFITPGLLGSIKKFNQQFAIPIERHQRNDVRKKLKKLIRPFILRRIKSQVLKELPPRTEIILHVEMSDEEAALYEALRQQALENLKNIHPLANKNTRDGVARQNIQILAEIMKLRRACCNAKLVMPESSVTSSKLEIFSKVLKELRDNKHKVLVFSQFVGHLAIIRDRLAKEKIRYRYLDGSTPTQFRKKEVDAFQAGRGDIFLISLKAGGLGLNLTAADYVIHMDPWWNPAVEDQASDRAHRIGQKRPVTIYRLVTRNTIEEKIVKLHQEKRDLANCLLEGTNTSGRMSSKELLNLIREQ